MNGKTVSTKLDLFFNLKHAQTFDLMQDLPSATVPQLQGILGCRVTLRNLDKKSWMVEVERGGEGYSFNKGWPQFYQQNSLKPNYVLLFTYKHENLFDFKVFGHNACEKEGVACPEIRVEEEVEEFTVMEEEEEDEDYVVDELEYAEEEPVCISKNRSKSCRLKRDFCSYHASKCLEFLLFQIMDHLSLFA